MIYLIYLLLTSFIVSTIIVMYIRLDNDIKFLPNIDIDDLNTIDKVKSLGFFKLFALIIVMTAILPFILIHMSYKKFLCFKG